MSSGSEGADADLEEWSREFYGLVREILVLFLLFTVLFITSHQLVSYYKRRRDREDYFSLEEDGPYRFSLFFCTFTLAVALAAILLLPFSILTCEVALRYPDNYYMQWLNVSLVKLVWNMVFFLSNFCLLCMMPFVYFFMEAEGFSGWRSGLHSRILETLVMLGLLLTLVSAIVWIISYWFLVKDGTEGSYLNVFPLVYSFLSLTGVFFTLLGLPVGIEQVIMWLGNQLVLPKADGQLDMLSMEEEDLKRRLEQMSSSSSMQAWSTHPTVAARSPSHSSSTFGSTTSSSSISSTNSITHRWRDDGYTTTSTPVPSPSMTTGNSPSPWSPGISNGGVSGRASAGLPGTNRLDLNQLRLKLEDVRRQRRNIKKRFGSSSFYWTMFFSLCTLFVLLLTGVALFSAGQSFIRLLVNPDALAMGATEVVLGRVKSSQTLFASLGALVEMAIVLFFAFSSLIGVYSSARSKSLRPQPGNTPMLQMILNCNIVLLLSSALPVLIRSLGISRFDLVGLFANLHWLTNWYLVMLYHLLFFVTIIYLWTRRVTRSVVAKVGTFFNLVANKQHTAFFQQRQSSSDSFRFSTPASPQSSLTGGPLYRQGSGIWSSQDNSPTSEYPLQSLPTTTVTSSSPFSSANSSSGDGASAYTNAFMSLRNSEPLLESVTDDSTAECETTIGSNGREVNSSPNSECALTNRSTSVLLAGH